MCAYLCCCRLATSGQGWANLLTAGATMVPKLWERQWCSSTWTEYFGEPLHERKMLHFLFHFHSILHVFLLPAGFSAVGKKVMWSSNQLSSHAVANFNSDSLNSFPLCYCLFSYQLLWSDCYYQSLCSSDETLLPDERSDPKTPVGRTNDVIPG